MEFFFYFLPLIYLYGMYRKRYASLIAVINAIEVTVMVTVMNTFEVWSLRTEKQYFLTIEAS